MTVDESTEFTGVDDGSTDNNSAKAITCAIGVELRLARENRYWSRPQLIKRLRNPMPVNTYAGYENGIRPCRLVCLHDICQALGTDVPELLRRAWRRLELPCSPAPSEDYGRRRYLDELDRRLRAVEDHLFPRE